MAYEGRARRAVPAARSRPSRSRPRRRPRFRTRSSTQNFRSPILGDDAPLEERARAGRAGARPLLGSAASDGVGILDPAAIEAVADESHPVVRDADELHDALLTLVALPPVEAWQPFYETLRADRAARRRSRVRWRDVLGLRRAARAVFAQIHPGAVFESHRSTRSRRRSCAPRRARRRLPSWFAAGWSRAVRRRSPNSRRASRSTAPRSKARCSSSSPRGRCCAARFARATHTSGAIAASSPGFTAARWARCDARSSRSRRRTSRALPLPLAARRPDVPSARNRRARSRSSNSSRASRFPRSAGRRRSCRAASRATSPSTSTAHAGRAR